MIRKTIIVMLTLAAISTAILWVSLSNGGGWSQTPDRHYMGFALIQCGAKPPTRLFNYRGYASLGIPVRWQAIRPYDVVILPLWSLFVLFSSYPVKAFLHRARMRRYVERDWFAVAVGMSAFAFAVFVIFFDTFDIFDIVDRAFESEAAGLVLMLVILVSIPALCAIVTHNVIAGPLRRASLRKPKTCVVCGYNLTGNESGICPECGRRMDADRSGG